MTTQSDGSSGGIRRVKCPTCNGDAVLTGGTHVTANSREFTEALMNVERLRQIVEVLVFTHDLEEVAVGNVTHRLGQPTGQIMRDILERGA